MAIYAPLRPDEFVDLLSAATDPPMAAYLALGVLFYLGFLFFLWRKALPDFNLIDVWSVSLEYSGISLSNSNPQNFVFLGFELHNLSPQHRRYIIIELELANGKIYSPVSTDVLEKNMVKGATDYQVRHQEDCLNPVSIPPNQAVICQLNFCIDSKVMHLAEGPTLRLFDKISQRRIVVPVWHCYDALRQRPYRGPIGASEPHQGSLRRVYHAVRNRLANFRPPPRRDAQR